MRPFVLVTVEDNAVSDTLVVGVLDCEVIVVDFDSTLDASDANDLIDQIVARYDNNANEVVVQNVLARLQDIVDEESLDDEEDDENDADDFTEDDDTDADMEDDEDMEFSDDDDEEDIDLGDEEDDEEDDEKKEEDYVGNEFNADPAVHIDPRD